jgi:hypothetical protein
MTVIAVISLSAIIRQFVLFGKKTDGQIGEAAQKEIFYICLSPDNLGRLSG